MNDELRQRLVEEEQDRGPTNRQMMENAITEFEAKKEKIFAILPVDCLLKPGGGLVPTMATLTQEPFLSLSFYSRKDICVQCDRELCHWYSKTTPRWWHVLKIELLAILARGINRKTSLRHCVEEQEVSSVEKYSKKTK